MTYVFRRHRIARMSATFGSNVIDNIFDWNLPTARKCSAFGMTTYLKRSNLAT